MLVDVTPVYENTTMQAYYNNENVLRAYYISPCEGYVLHSTSLDFPEFDEETMTETGVILEGYTRSVSTVPYNYDFEANPKQIYAKLESEVPADQIFGGGSNNDHEVMSEPDNNETI